MQTYIGTILDGVRRDTRNADDTPSPDSPGLATTKVGIYTEDFLRYANFAQQRLQGKITKKHPFVFEAQSTISIVADQAAYDIPDHVFLGTRIRLVEYSRTGETKDYKRLPPKQPYIVYSGSNYPSAYHRRDGQVILEPIPSTATGSLRVTYERTLDKLDLRRSKVTGTPGVVTGEAGNTSTNSFTVGGAFTGSAVLNYRVKIDGTGPPNTFTWSDDGGSTWDDTAVAIDLTAQTLNNGLTITWDAITGGVVDDYWDFDSQTEIALLAAAGTAMDATDDALIEAAQYICINDKYGNVMLYNGVVSSYTGTGTDIVTLAASVSTYLVTGYTLADLDGGYLTYQKYSSTHSKLHEDCERYVSEYTARRIFKRESSDDAGEINKVLQEMEDDIIASYRNADKDIHPIPIMDYDIMYVDYGPDRWRM